MSLNPGIVLKFNISAKILEIFVILSFQKIRIARKKKEIRKIFHPCAKTSARTISAMINFMIILDEALKASADMENQINNLIKRQ